jgi:adenosylmethionine-8-amino-7-oxononanoate aminotransferase
MSSWWCAVHGYNNPSLNSAASSQLSAMSHVMFGGLTHRPAVTLGSALRDLSPPSLKHVFLADSGSVSVEVSLKMAIQYHRGRGAPARTRFMTCLGGYHGDTFGCMSVCDPMGGMHRSFGGAVRESIFVPKPPEIMGDDNVAELTRAFEEHSHELAAFIIEPLVQGAGGMRFYDPAYLRLVRELCTKHGVLLICDEIATGFGRSGGDALWASTQAGVEPDIMCIGKALTGGYMTLGATLASEEVAAGVSAVGEDNVAMPLMHGPTFMGNPLACAVACESINLLMRPTGSDGLPWFSTRTAKISQWLESGLRHLTSKEGVADVRIKGAIGVIEMKKPLDTTAVTKLCPSLGAWLRPFGKLLYTMPPYVIEEEDLGIITNAMEAIVDEFGKE